MQTLKQFNLLLPSILYLLFLSEGIKKEELAMKVRVEILLQRYHYNEYDGVQLKIRGVGENLIKKDSNRDEASEIL